MSDISDDSDNDCIQRHSKPIPISEFKKTKEKKERKSRAKKAVEEAPATPTKEEKEEIKNHEIVMPTPKSLPEPATPVDHYDLAIPVSNAEVEEHYKTMLDSGLPEKRKRGRPRKLVVSEPGKKSVKEQVESQFHRIIESEVKNYLSQMHKDPKVFGTVLKNMSKNYLGDDEGEIQDEYAQVRNIVKDKQKKERAPAKKRIPQQQFPPQPSFSFF